MDPCHLLLLLTWLWPVDCSRTPSTSHHRNDRRSPSYNLRSPKSVEDIGCIPTDGTFYTGNASTTETGLTCQMWSVKTPHDHSNTDIGKHNHCRDTFGEMKAWCFTTDPGTRWQYCTIPFCVTYTKGIKITKYH